MCTSFQINQRGKNESKSEENREMKMRYRGVGDEQRTKIVKKKESFFRSFSVPHSKCRHAQSGTSLNLSAKKGIFLEGQ